MILVAMETILAENYEFLSYQNACIYKLAQRQYTSYSIEFYIIGKGGLPTFS